MVTQPSFTSAPRQALMWQLFVVPMVPERIFDRYPESPIALIKSKKFRSLHRFPRWMTLLCKDDTIRHMRGQSHLIRMGVSLSCQRGDRAPATPVPCAFSPMRIAFLLDLTDKAFSVHDELP